MKLIFTLLVVSLAGCATISEDECRTKHDKALECEIKGLVWVDRSWLCITHGLNYQLTGY